MKREDVILAIESEREYQDKKWGTIQERGHSVLGWVTLIRYRLRKADEAWSSSRGDEAALIEIRKVISIAVACCEQHRLEPYGDWRRGPAKELPWRNQEVGGWLTLLNVSLRDLTADYGLTVIFALIEYGIRCCEEHGVPSRSIEDIATASRREAKQ